MENQIYIFIIFVLNGFLISILFDIFRIKRRAFKTNDFFTILEDILFWILVAIILLYSIFKFSNGILRAYMFIGIAIGVIIYMILFSKIFIKTNLFIINIVKKLVNNIIIFPLAYILKLFKRIIFKPITFLCINFRKKCQILKIKTKN